MSSAATVGNASLVRVQDVTKDYAVGEVQVPALRGVSLEIGTGEFVSIVGASGSGKSTLLHVVAGLTRPTSGQIWIAGTEYGGLGEGGRTTLRRRMIGIVFQKFNLFPTLDAGTNIEIAHAIASGGRRASAEQRDYQNRLIDLLGIRDRLHHRPTQLSGGEQQRVAIARALVNRPRLLLADEPTGNLDTRNSDAVLGVLAELNRDLGQTIMMITHNAAAAAVGHRVLHMQDGQMVAV